LDVLPKELFSLCHFLILLLHLVQDGHARWASKTECA
jgi:hypothetical protein